VLPRTALNRDSHTGTNATPPAFDHVGDRTIKSEVKMKLWETFNSDVPGIVFWPIMIVMLGILIPIVMAIR
jgi:hypothetical protein